LPSGCILNTKIHLELLNKKIKTDSFIVITKNFNYQIISKNNIENLTRKAINFESNTIT